jgi:orotate phosphoribosyltransferase
MWRGRLLGRHAGMVFVADDLAAWLIGLLADAGRKKMTTLVLGSEQERALRSAATAAVKRTADELRPGDEEKAEQLALVISEVFGGPMPGGRLTGDATVLEALQAGIAGQLAVLDNASLTDTGQSSADVLGVPGAIVAQKLTAHLLREIIARGARGGPLFPLASQLNDDVTHLQGQRIEAILGQLAGEVREALARPPPQAAVSGASPEYPDKGPVERSPQRLSALNLIKAYGYERRATPFKLSSGKLSIDYVDCKAAFSTGERLRIACGAMIELAHHELTTFTCVGGPTMGADPIAMTIAMMYGCGWFSVRKEPKARGLQRRIEGARLSEDDSVLLVDDVVITGRYLLHAYHEVCLTGAKVVGVMPVLDRAEAGQRLFSSRNVPYSPLFTYKDLGIAAIAVELNGI